MILRGLVVLCPFPLSYETAEYSRLDVQGEGMVLRGLVLLCPRLLIDTAVFSRFTLNVEGMVLRGLVLLCPLPRS